MDRAAALFGRLRALRSRAQSARNFVSNLQKVVLAVADPAARASELTAAVLEGKASFEADGREAESLLSEILAIVKEADQLYCAWGDNIAAIQSGWSKTSSDRQKVAHPPLPDPEHLLARLIAALDEVIYQCCEITVPDRITAHLKLLPIGAPLDFREAFMNELPAAEQRLRFLRYLNLYPGFVAGWVDVQNQRILRASDRSWRRIASLAVTLSIALAGFGVIALACYFGGPRTQPSGGWPFTEELLQPYLSAYACLLFGSIAHVVIALLKQDRAAAESPQYLSNWVLRVHVRETSYFLSAFSLRLGAIAMAFLFHGSADWKTAFFLGYSYDSFMDLFIRRFEDAVPKVTDLVAELSVP